MSEPQTSTEPPAKVVPAKPAEQQDSLLRQIFTGNAMVSVLAIVLSIVIGGILMAITNPKVAETAGYFFAKPGDLIAEVLRPFGALIQGSIFNWEGVDAAAKFYPITETLTVATPLICAGLGVALAFRAGLFNIGAQGQIIIGAFFGAYIGFAWHLPWGLHLILVILAGLLGGAIWGGVVGLLKARTGAHEVIVTIMLNYVANFLLAYLLTLPAFQRPGSSNPISPFLDDTAQFPLLLGSQFRLHAGFLLAVLATVLVWWLLNRSTLGFEFRAVGANPHASKTAGINVARSTIVVMAIAGALAGLAGVMQVSGTEKYLSGGVSASIGFDAITVALLGRSTPWGTFFAGLLFGAFRAGGVVMQSETGTPIDIVLVIQSLIVLFIAAPPLVRAIFGLNKRKKKTKAKPASAETSLTGGATV
ncbi:simple sugar transport system permease protein [Psychromicrobium silvestre]|uniref:Simple sugar transport system permease protein n=1 Tax=Psychromicrobium silvestre TaxID=1645614 RepID=A0A7Y9S818_9MICC|nr:ABC transporter permease [Psychromicrobium silvestre]NYE96483.1 simple sugar transport system permease protein [Psychromicrobium silvestre]